MKKKSSPSIIAQLKSLLTSYVVLSFIVIGGAIFYASFRIQSDQLKNIQQVRAEAIAEKVNLHFDGLQQKLTQLAQVQGLTTLDPAAQQALLKKLSADNKAFEMIGITDNNGHLQQALSKTNETIPEEWGDTAAFQRAIQGEDYSGPVEISKQRTHPILILAEPVRNEQNQVDGVVLARINLNLLQTILNETKTGENDFAYILDQQLLVIARSDDTSEEAVLEDLSQNSLGNLLSKSVNDVPKTYRGLRNELVLGNTEKISSINGLLVIELPIKDAYAPQLNLLYALALILMIGVILFRIFGTSLVRDIVQPLEPITSTVTQLNHAELDALVVMDHENKLKTLANLLNRTAVTLSDTIIQTQQETVALKQAEQNSILSAWEKEIQSKEVHQRVNTNLQTLSSLLRHQSQNSKDKITQAMLLESQKRTAMMALVHKILNQSSNLENINFANYARDLGRSLFDTYGVDPSRVALSVDADELTLDIHNAMPCGLMINEIVSNSLKHAFPDQRHGNIRIKLDTSTWRSAGLEPADRFMLTLSDDGVGLPADFETRAANSLGTNLIERLAEQIQGTLERSSSSQGTSYVITFPHTS